MNGIFTTYAPLYRAKGFWPRPATPGTKACKEPGWAKSDLELGGQVLASWDRTYGHYGIGLLMGSPLADGTRLAALDIDDDRYVSIGEALLGGVLCGRIGSKGVALFVRVTAGVKSASFKVKLPNGSCVKTADFLCAAKLCVIPPTIHPGTGQPYRWISAPLLDIDPLTLPLIGD